MKIPHPARNLKDHQNYKEKLYKKMIRKYQIKEDEFILQRISEKMRDHSVSGGDKIKFYKLLEFMKFES